MAIAIDAVSTAVIANGNSSVSFSHTTTGSNLLMAVCVHLLNDGYETVTSITYNGDSLTLLDAYEEADDGRVEMWYRYAPATGANTVVVNVDNLGDAKSAAVVGVVTFSGAHQSAAFGVVDKNNETDAGDDTAGSVTVSSATDEIVLAMCTAEAGGPFTTTNATERWDSNEGDCYGVGATATGATSLTVTFTLNTADHWAAMGVGIKPAPAVAGTADLERGVLRGHGRGVYRGV